MISDTPMIKKDVLKNSQLKFVLTIIICCLVVFSCTLRAVLTTAHADDINFHSVRILGIAQALKNGQFPVKSYNTFYQGQGYLSPLFYGDLFLYLPALFINMGMSLKISYYLFTYIITFCIMIFMYFLVKKFVKNKTWAVIGSTLFTISQYVFVDIFYRAAIGESIAIIFYIVFALAVYNLLKENYTKPWLFSIAFLGFLFSHMTSLVIAAVLLVIIVLINCKKFFPQKKFWLKSLLAFGMFIGIGFYNLFSFLEMYFSDKYFVSQPWVVPSNEALGFLDTFSIGKKVWGVGFICLLAIILLPCLNNKEIDKDNKRIIKWFVILSTILILIVSKLFPWKLFDKVLSFIQFPWRLNILPTMMLTIALTMELQILIKYYKKIVITIMVLIVAFTIPYNNLRLVFSKNFTFIEYYDIGIKNLEWLPLKAGQSGQLDDINLYKSNGDKIEYTRKTNDSAIIFIADDGTDFYVAPIIYYKGYTATIELNDGTIKELEVKQNENGKTTVVTNGLKGTVQVYYKGTTIQNVGIVISSISAISVVIGGLAYYIQLKKKNKKLTKVATINQIQYLN